MQDHTKTVLTRLTASLGILGIIATFSLIALHEKRQWILNAYQNSLSSVVMATSRGLQLRIDEKKRLVSLIGQNEALVAITQALLQLNYHDPDNLIESELLVEARSFFNQRSADFGDVGFFLIAPDGLSLASTRDNVGNLNLIAKHKPILFSQALQGEAVFIPPIPSDVMVAGSSTTMFVLAPIRTSDNQVIGALSQRLIPNKAFSETIRLSNLGETGQTLIFNEEGDVLAHSSTTPLPDFYGRDLIAYVQSQIITANSGSDMMGHLDERGEKVFSAWHWDANLGVGVMTKINAREVLSGYRQTSKVLLSVLAVTFSLIIAGLIILMVNNARFKRQLYHANNQLEDMVKERTRELEVARRDAESSSQAKAQFIANMSHEIRTPMNGVLGFVELALGLQSLDEEARSYLGKAHRTAKSLLGIINDVLDFSKIEAEKIVLERLCFNLHNLTTEVFESFLPIAKKKNVAIELSIGSTVPECFEGDPLRLRQVIVNLMSNALKFTEQGRVKLSVDYQEDVLGFVIQDTGIGMSTAQMDTIFESFTQADTSTTRLYGGTGLGTTIAKKIVEAMGGQIKVNSKEGVGSIFSFFVNLPTVTCSGKCYLHLEPLTHKYQSPRLFEVLLVEDQELNAELIQINLEKNMGHKVHWVVNGQFAVDLIKEGARFDLILMDVQMPVMNGLDACRAIREWEQKKGIHIPVVALTASVTQEDQRNCMAAGMDGFVHKPVEISSLLMEMERVVPKTSVLVADSKTPNAEAGPLELNDFLSVKEIHRGIQLWGSEEVFIHALKSFEHFHSKDAHQLQRLLAEDRREEAKRLLHNLKGMSLGLTNITNLASKAFSAFDQLEEQELHKVIEKLETAMDAAAARIRLLKNIE